MQATSTLLIAVVSVERSSHPCFANANLLGKSDPYAQFTLNDQKVFKSEVVKKTVSPVWDQSFVALVVS